MIEVSHPGFAVELKPLNVSFVVRNLGRLGSPRFSVGLFKGEEVVDRVSVERLNVNSTVSGTLTWWSPEPGTHLLSVCADPEGVVEELDEDNNCVKVSVLVRPYPRLNLSSPGELRVKVGDIGVLSVHVKNVGSVVAREVMVIANSTGGVELLDEPVKRIGFLGPKRSVRVRWRFRAVSPGRTVMLLLLKAADMPDVTGLARIYVTKPLPDLKARLFMPGLAEEGYPVNVSVVVTNSGETSSTPFALGLYLNDTLYSYKSLRGIGVDERRSISFLISDLDVGEYSVKACVDVFDEVKELNETNNCASSVLRVRIVPPRLKIIGFYAPYRVVEGEEFLILLAIENTGSLTAEDVEARLILQPGIEFVGGERSSKPLGNIPPRKSAEVTWSLIGKERGSYRIIVRVTARNAPDQQESLNLRVLRPAALGLEVKLLSYKGLEVEEVKVGDVLRLVIIVSNEGEAELRDITVTLDLSQAEGLRLAPKERPSKRLKYLEGGSARQITWFLEAVRSGRSWVAVTVSSGAIEDYEVIPVEIKE
ncbi:MAG: hypothetical protein DRJ51_08475 [Thermoprotei archaeon]|nr:MAG: hypothetical protein DRJ51_08475 [Thermoprotei archaeon]